MRRVFVLWHTFGARARARRFLRIRLAQRSIGKEHDAIRVVAGRYGAHDHAPAEVDDRDGVVGHVGDVGKAVVRQSPAK